MKVNVGGVLVDNLTKQEVLTEVDICVQMDKSVYIVTPYSEMIVFAFNDPHYRKALNSAHLALPDGVGIIWAAKYLSLKSNWITAIWQIVYTGAAIIFNKKYVQSVIMEQISGSRLIHDLAKLSIDKNYSLALVGGEGNVAAQAAYELKKMFPNLKINLALSGRPFGSEIIKEINDSNSDILLIAYSPPKQELWLYENYQKLNTKVAIGLGGTFDYLAGKRHSPPHLVHKLGLEWLWRLVTQPWRIRRIWNAVPVFIWKMFKYKVENNARN